MKNPPQTWRCDRLKDIATINSSALSASTDPDYEFDYLEISNVGYHGIIDQQPPGAGGLKPAGKLRNALTV